MAEAAPLILIAERDERVRELQRFFLERAGFAVEFCGDGVTALAAVRSRLPALLVTEILLPGVDGLTLCRQVREDPQTGHVPVVVFSILAAAARAADAGAAAFLRKPIVENTFLATVVQATVAQPPAPMEQQWASM